jgi:hypothetical protein
LKEGEEIRDRLARRTEKKTFQKPMLLEAADIMVTGEPPKKAEEEKKDFFPPEMILTPGEREVVMGIEQKMAKRGYHCNVRFVYLGQKEVFFKAKLRFALSFFSAFATQNLNALMPYGQPFITKVRKSWFLPLNLARERRLYFRKRSLFRKYRLRVDPLFPLAKKFPSSFILNSEELATLFHFPGKAPVAAPFVERIESKKGEAPPGLPTEL